MGYEKAKRWGGRTTPQFMGIWNIIGAPRVSFWFQISFFILELDRLKSKFGEFRTCWCWSHVMLCDGRPSQKKEQLLLPLQIDVIDFRLGDPFSNQSSSKTTALQKAL